MRFRAAFPRVTSTVQTSPVTQKPIIDGHLPLFANVWRVPPNTVALCGRPAVWIALDVNLPEFSVGPLRFRSRRIRWEQDFGGHLYLVVVGESPSDAYVLESGPYDSGTGALAPFAYPEDSFYNRGMIDFDPVAIHPPLGLSAAEFAELLFTAHREYDGNQMYTAIEIPFLRVGRDSNSYVVGMLLSAGLDLREIPKPYRARRFEWSGYPGAEDPVHRANFGGYLGEPHTLADGTATASFHGDHGEVRFVSLAGEPHGAARLSDGTMVPLDARGRGILGARFARDHGLPVKHTAPPAHIAGRARFPKNPALAGANITLVVDGISLPLSPGHVYAGTITSRNEALGLATMTTDDGRTVHFPLVELGLELRDPKRIDAALQIGEFLSIGLHSDRRPRFHARGRANFSRSAAQIGPEVGFALLGIAVVAAIGVFLFRSLRS